VDINKLTENAQKAITTAQAEAARSGHPAVEVEHLLHSLTTQTDGLIPRLIEKLGAQPARFAERLESEIARLPKVSGPGASPGGTVITPRLQSLLGRAASEATKLKDDYISVEHLLLAALQEDSHTGAAKVLK
jgi:ATP-dependent Clp protease ATP-binding subunit ClpB